MDKRTCRCGTDFIPTHGRQTCCTPDCRKPARAKIPIACYRCGVIRLKEPSTRYKQFCGTTCRDRFLSEQAARIVKPKRSPKPKADTRSRIRVAYEQGNYGDLLVELKAKTIINTDGCWIWQGRIKDGYPIQVIGSRYHQAHRLSLESHLASPLGSQPAHHMCATTACINPAHLQPVTHRENVAEMMARNYMEQRIRELESALAKADPSNVLLTHVSIPR